MTPTHSSNATANAQVAALSAAEKRALVEQLLQKKASAAKSVYPQSYNQQAMWFLYQLSPDSPAYNTAFAARLRSRVDVDALTRALQVLVDRHPALRTTFATSEQGPVQYVYGYRAAPFYQVTVTDPTEESLTAQVAEAYAQPFDLEQGPALRMTLFSLAEEDHVLLITAHHIIMDGWSIGVLLQELLELYQANVDQTAATLPALTVRYADYVQRQRQLLEGPTGERLWSFWQEELAAELPILDLPTDYPRPPVQTFAGATHVFTLDADLTAKVRTFARHEGATMYMTLLAAFQALLALWTHQDDDIIVGSPMAGRNDAAFSGVIGDFINMVVIRTHCPRGITFRTLLAAVRRKVLAALEHQEFPFALLVERLNLKRDASRSPIFQVAFDLQKLQQFGDLAPLFLSQRSDIQVHFATLVLEPYFLPQQEGQFELTMQLVEANDQILGALKYSTDLFELETVQCLQEMYTSLLRKIMAAPELNLTEDIFSFQEMSVAAFMSYLRKHDIKLWVDGERLRVNAPAGTLTTELQKAIGSRKAEIVHRLKETNGTGQTSFPIQPVAHTGPMELSYAQRRLWFLEQLNPGSVVYNIPLVFEVKGRLQVDLLQRSLDEILARHAALRSRFIGVHGQVRQVVEPSGSVELRLIDLRHLPAVARQKEADELAKAEGLRPFDLSRGPFLRALLVQMEAEKSLLSLTIHHIVSDAWSLGILGNELSKLYAAYAHGQPSPLAALPVQYVDYAHWQQRWLQGERLRAQLAYWQQQLRGPLPLLDLPTDHPRPTIQSSRGRRNLFNVGAALSEELKEFSRSEGTTLFVTLFAAFNVLLYRYTRQEDIVVGSPISGRSRAEIENLIGFFVNNLVLRTDLSGGPTFRDLLKRVRNVALDAYANQDVPFEKLVEVLQPERDMSRLPFFQVLFGFQSMAIKSLEMPDARLEPRQIDIGTTRYDLSFEVWESAEGLVVSVEYSSDLFEEATILRMVDHYRELLCGIVAQPDQFIAKLPLLTTSERLQMVNEWNRTHLDYPRGAGVHTLFEAQAARNPQAIAVTFEDQEITYGELNRRANQLARHLRELGVDDTSVPEALVGVYMTRSIEMIIALLAIHKAGGAYLPLDPAFPADRLAFMMEDAQARVLVTQSQLSRTLPFNPARVVQIDDDWPVIACQNGTDLGLAPDPEGLAYLLYTSGSTGRPKGVQVPHRCVVNFLTSMRVTPGMVSTDVLLSVTTLSFDIAGLEIFLPLTTGARVVLVRSEVAANGSHLIAALQHSGATVMQATPATWRLLVGSGWEGTPGLKILCGGEAMTGELADQLLPRCASLWNMYGPTETTIWSTVYQVSVSASVMPIGKPIANTQVYVLDAA